MLWTAYNSCFPFFLSHTHLCNRINERNKHSSFLCSSPNPCLLGNPWEKGSIQQLEAELLSGMIWGLLSLSLKVLHRHADSYELDEPSNPSALLPCLGHKYAEREKKSHLFIVFNKLGLRQTILEETTYTRTLLDWRSTGHMSGTSPPCCLSAGQLSCCTWWVKGDPGMMMVWGVVL